MAKQYDEHVTSWSNQRVDKYVDHELLTMELPSQNQFAMTTCNWDAYLLCILFAVEHIIYTCATTANALCARHMAILTFYYKRT